MKRLRFRRFCIHFINKGRYIVPNLTIFYYNKRKDKNNNLISMDGIYIK